MDDNTLIRLESKVDRLAAAVAKLVLIEERQTTQGQRIGQVEQRMAGVESAQRATDGKVDRWVNRGIGVWAVAAAIYTFLKDWR